MEREFLATGKTVQEAIEAAYEKAGVDREYVTVEIIERPSKKFFGLKTVPATAKAVIDEDYFNKMFAQKEKKFDSPRKKREFGRENREFKKESKPKFEKTSYDAQKDKKQEKTKKEQKPQQPKKEFKKEVAPIETIETKVEEPVKEEVRTLSPEVIDQKGNEAAAYIKEVLTALGFADATVTFTQKDGMIVLQLSGEEMGTVVGRRGENLDAMQYLASLVANRSDGGYVRVVLDVDDYRSKREASLRAYARKTAFNVVKSGRSMTLEPMNPYERRIVHSAVQTVSGATSKSIGNEPNRKVIISCVDGNKFRGDRKFRDNKGERRNNSRGNRSNNESRKPTFAPTSEAPKNDSNTVSLYGRIDLD